VKAAAMQPEAADLGRLQRRWAELVAPFGADGPAAEEVFRQLVEHYGGAGRFYHNLAHLQDVLDHVDALRHRARDLPAVRLAAWFHDVIYDPRAADSEERSAAFAAEALRQLRAPPETVVRAAALILLTKTHQADDTNADAQVLLDADLAILGAPQNRYDSYSRAIRQEYAWVPDEKYREGRREVLRRFLRRPRIYRTPELSAALEAQARHNLNREIATLV
jgi:predicted metal-dependent HD superfamily phosphohydrolase